MIGGERCPPPAHAHESATRPCTPRPHGHQAGEEREALGPQSFGGQQSGGPGSPTAPALSPSQSPRSGVRPAPDCTARSSCT